MGERPGKRECGLPRVDGRPMHEWITETPDGRRLTVRREREAWVVRRGEGEETRNTLLDIALIDAIRGNVDLIAHSAAIDYGAWTRTIADRIECEA
jgi:hypothetical protein